MSDEPLRKASYKRVRGMIEAWLEGRVTDSYIKGQILKAHSVKEAKQVIEDNESYFALFKNPERTLDKLKRILDLDQHR